MLCSFSFFSFYSTGAWATRWCRQVKPKSNKLVILFNIRGSDALFIHPRPQIPTARTTSQIEQRGCHVDNDVSMTLPRLPYTPRPAALYYLQVAITVSIANWRKLFRASLLSLVEPGDGCTPDDWDAVVSSRRDAAKCYTSHGAN